MTFRTTPEDDERPRAKPARRNAEGEPGLAAGKASSDRGDPLAKHPAAGAQDRRAAEPRRKDARELRPLGGFGSRAERGERLLSLAFCGFSDAALRGLRRELAARLTEVAPGSQESRTLGALSGAVRRELAQRAARGGPRGAA